MSEQTTVSLPEAPAAATVKVKSSAGFEWLMTTRAATMGEILERLPTIEKWLSDHNYSPAVGGKFSSAAPAGNGSAPQGAAPVCQYHGPMKRSTKFNGWYCPAKMGDGSYCKESVKD